MWQFIDLDLQRTNLWATLSRFQHSKMHLLQKSHARHFCELGQHSDAMDREKWRKLLRYRHSSDDVCFWLTSCQLTRIILEKGCKMILLLLLLSQNHSLNAKKTVRLFIQFELNISFAYLLYGKPVVFHHHHLFAKISLFLWHHTQCMAQSCTDISPRIDICRYP